MKNYIGLPVMLLALVCCSCSPPPETMIEGGYDQQEMDEAIARARAEVDTFIDELSRGNGEDFSVKAPIQDNGGTEHFWLTDVVYRDGGFEGNIGNEPGRVRNVEFGQKWKVKKDEISDWTFSRGDKLHGNYTMRSLLKTMPKEEAEALRALFASP